jgi:hypothetical protein
MYSLVSSTQGRDAEWLDQMSIRRKTCETMTLLYEAALKTNPDFDETKDRPTAINPTPGVAPREDLGKAIWIKDPTQPHGGHWLAESEQDAIASGVPMNYVEIGQLLPKAAEASNTPLNMPGAISQADGEGLFQDMQSASNVNPQMNAREDDGVQGQDNVQSGLDFGGSVGTARGSC